MTKSSIVFVIQLFIMVFAFSQKENVSDKFRSPMDIPLIVAGNFGEVRSNHFHTGIDFKTQGVEGKKIYAIGDGYISRIGYSHYGYGKVLYVSHPNGYTSVYAHLSKFNSSISSTVREHQYSIQEETFNLYLDSGKIEVKKGQVIALSGNSGSSFAPHLHFEIRETISENPMNPLLFGYKIVDSKKPMINNLKLYALDSNSLVNGTRKNRIIRIKKNKKGNYFVPEKVTAFGNIGFALHSTDRLNARNICGLYSLDLSVNGDHLFGHTMDKLDFSTSRFVNHHVDYPRHKQYNNSFHKSFLKGNNPLEIYNHNTNGITNFHHDSTYKFLYQAKDFSGNLSSLSFNIKGDSMELKNSLINTSVSCFRTFSYNKSNYFDTIGFSVLMTENTLYDDACINYVSWASDDYLSQTHTIGSKFIGIQKSFKLFIELDKEIDSNYFSKLCIVKVMDGGKISDRGGNYQMGKVTTRVKEFGAYAISIDTIMPVVKLLSDTAKLTRKSKLVFKISDNLSGIQSYNATLDGAWILTQYKRKKGKWYISLSEGESIGEGTHTLQVEVIDEKGNSNFQSLTFSIKK